MQLSIECGGPIGGIYTEGWANGSVRGYSKNNPIPLTRELTSLDLDELYGPGFLTISKLFEGKKTPFSGQTMLQWGDLAKDLATHFDQSEQTPTHFILSIDFNDKAQVVGAGAPLHPSDARLETGWVGSACQLRRRASFFGEDTAERYSVKSFVETHFTGVDSPSRQYGHPILLPLHQGTVRPVHPTPEGKRPRRHRGKRTLPL